MPTYSLTNFSKNRMKIKNFGQERGVHFPGVSRRSATAFRWFKFTLGTLLGQPFSVDNFCAQCTGGGGGVDLLNQIWYLIERSISHNSYIDG